MTHKARKVSGEYRRGKWNFTCLNSLLRARRRAVRRLETPCRANKRTNDRYGRDADVLHLHMRDGAIKEFKPNNLFIMDWAFASHNSEVVIKSMAHHGASCFIKYDIQSGRATGHVDGYVPEEQMPKWARPLAD